MMREGSVGGAAAQLQQQWLRWWLGGVAVCCTCAGALQWIAGVLAIREV
jgi:hypothetical protein